MNKPRPVFTLVPSRHGAAWLERQRQIELARLQLARDERRERSRLYAVKMALGSLVFLVFVYVLFFTVPA